MRHEIEFNDALGIYMCEVCGTAFTQDALIAEMDAHGCPGPKADEAGWTGYTVTGSHSVYPVDLTANTPFFYTYTWYHPDERPTPYEDAETKGRKLVKRAGYMNDDET